MTNALSQSLKDGDKGENDGLIGKIETDARMKKWYSNNYFY